MAAQLLERPKQLRRDFEGWLKKQPPQVEVAVATVLGAGQGAFLGFLLGGLSSMNPAPPAGASPEVARSMEMMRANGPWGQARGFAALSGVNAGLALAVKHIRHGKEDVWNTMISGFGGGAVFSLVNTPSPATPLRTAFTTGVLFGALQGLFFQISQRFVGQGAAASTPEQYVRVRYMLQKLGLEAFEKNCKKGLLTDDTIMMWNNSALKEARVPPGPRLRILHHLSTTKPNLMKPAMPVPEQIEGGGR